MNNLFNSNEERELYIKICAEGQIEWERGLTCFNRITGKTEPTFQAKNPRTMEEALRIARIQVECDEKAGELRYSMEGLLTKNYDELLRKSHEKWLSKFKYT